MQMEKISSCLVLYHNILETNTTRMQHVAGSDSDPGSGIVYPPAGCAHGPVRNKSKQGAAILCAALLGNISLTNPP
jgi:hypothetical protein